MATISSLYLESSFGGGYTGLATVGYALMSNAGAVVVARTTTGVFEQAGGTYGVVVPTILDTVASVEWDTGGASPVYAHEDIQALIRNNQNNLDAKVSDVEADTQDIQSRLPAALVGGKMDSYVDSVAAGAIDAAAIATDAIDADALATSAINEIADGVWDEDIVAAHGTSDTAGLLLRVLGALISQRTNNATLNALLGIADSAGVDLPEQINTELETTQGHGAGSWTGSGATAVIADAIWDEDIVAAHGAADSAGLLLRVLGDAISDRTNNANLNALLGIADSAGITVESRINDVETDTQDIQTRLPAALVGGRMDSYVGSVGAGAIDAAAIATAAIDADAIAADAIGASELATSAVNEIRDAILSDSTPFPGANIDAAISTRATQAQILSDATPFPGANIDATISSRATQTSVDDIQNTTRFAATIPWLVVPAAGSTTYDLYVNLEDTNGNPEDPDTNTITIGVTNQAGASRTANLDATTMTRLSAGRYRSRYTVASTHALEQLLFTFSYSENAVAFVKDKVTTVVDEVDTGFTSTDRTNLLSVLADTNETQTKLPTNNIMGSSDKSDKDDEIDAILTDTADMQPKLGTPVTDISADIAAIQADTDNIQTRLPAALVGGKMDSYVDSVAAGAIDAAAIATDAIDADALATSAINEIADGIWDEDIVAAHGTSDTAGLLLRVLGALISQRTNNATLNALLGVVDVAGRDLPEQVDVELSATHGAGSWTSAGAGLTAQQVRDAMKLAPTVGAPAAGSVDEHLDDILADTNETQTKLPTNNIMGSSDKTDKDDDIDAILTDTADMQPKLGTPAGASISADIAAIQADTDNIQTRLPTTLVGGKMDSYVDSVAAGAIDAAAIATDAIDADALATSAVNEIVGAMNDLNAQEVRDAMKLAPTVGAPAAGSVDEHLDDVLADTADMQPKLGTPVTDVSADIAAIQADTDNIQTRLPAALVGGRMDSDIGNMQTDIIDANALATSAIAEVATYLETGGPNPHGTGAWDTAATPQAIRDAMKLAPTGGAPAAGSVDEHLDDILADTAAMQPLVDQSISSTESNIRGTDGDTLKTLSDQIDGLSAGAVAATGVVAAGSTTTEVRTNLTQADGFWNNMVMVIENTSGGGERVARNIDQYTQLNGALYTFEGLPFTPQAGDNVCLIARTGSLRDDRSPVVNL